MRYGKVVETQSETLTREQAPNVSAIQCWLFNRLPDKWKKNRDNLIELDDEDTKIHVTVTRANQSAKSGNAQQDNNEDDDWQDEVNQSIEIRNATEEELAERAKHKDAQKQNETENKATKVEIEAEDDLDYWPDDWEDDEEW